MGVTQFSFILLPLCLIWIMSPNRLIQLMVLASVFEAAAALTIGSLGVQPGLVPAIALLSYVGLQMLLGVRYPGEAKVWHLTRPFVLVTLYALVSSYLMPRLFEGKVFVWPQKADYPYVLTLLTPTPTNMNQDIYLVANCAIMVFTAIYLTRSKLPLVPFIRTFFASGFIVAGVAVWQFANKVAGVPYPTELFYSNPGWAILTGQSIGSVPRINGPFSEPSSLASYMASIVCATGWLMLQGNRDRMVRVLFVVGLLTMALSTSTTGFAVLAALAVGVPIYALVSGSTRLLGKIIRVGVPLILFLGFIFMAVSLFVPSFGKNAQDVLEATLNKQQSSSYEDRTSADVDSLAATWDTYGLGAGWGSNRSSSLVPGLLAGIGVPGVAGLLWFGFGLAGEVRQAKRMRCSPDQLVVIDGCCGGLVGFLLTAVLAGPTLSSVSFYFLLSLLIACVIRVKMQARARVAWNVRRAAEAPVQSIASGTAA